MVLTDPDLPDNPVVFVNRAFTALTGYESEAIVGRNCRCLQGADTDRDTVRTLREAVVGRRSIGVEVVNYKRDGTPFWNAINLCPIYDRQGRLAYCFASQADVTARRKADATRHTAEKLEALGQLTAGAAHDFNNLLQVATGSIELLRGRLPDDTLTRFVDNAAYAANRAAVLTAQLLAFGRRTPLQPRAIDLAAFVDERRAMLEAALGGYIALRLKPQRGVPRALIDPRHLEIALIHLLNNARDAMPQGGTVAITVASLGRSAGVELSDLDRLDYVVLSVADEGEGMPPKVLERAPEPFFTTRRARRASGLGLSMVHGFVRQSLGRLEIDSETGYGTTVRMIFPTVGRLSRAGAQGGDGKSGLDCSVDVKTKRASETVLVVEDNDDVLVEATEYLGGLGYRVLAARSAEEALEMARGRDAGIDLLFTDIHMPGGMNGVVLANMIGAGRPGLPVLFANGSIGDLTGAAEGGGRSADVLEKPYRCSELARRVRAALGRKPSPGTP